MTGETGITVPQPRKRLSSGPSPVGDQITSKSLLKDVAHQNKVRKQEEEEEPKAAPNNGWGMFKDRETFVALHIC